MPLLAINLSDKLFQEIKPLIERGLYQSFEAFVEIAAFNQLALERGAAPTEIIDRGHRTVNHSSQQLNGTPINASTTTAVESPVPKTPSKRVALKGTPKAKEDEIVSAHGAFERLAKVEQIDLLPRPCLPSEHDPADRPFGQVNRLFPLKLACRWLANHAKATNEWPRLDLISDRMADDAAVIGSLLYGWDESGKRKRERLGTGLPIRGSSASQDRFIAQFVARMTRGGDVFPGAIFQYELAHFDGATLVLTEPGLRFSALNNPIIDEQDQESLYALSDEEAVFLVGQVIQWIPAERNDMSIVLRAVFDGYSTPTGLGAALRGQFPSEWTESVAATHISGLVARLSELRLLRRQWQGRNVQYSVARKVLTS